MSKLKAPPAEAEKKSNNFLTRDVKNVARHGSASIAELRDFMARMKGKGAGEVLGEISKSGLARGVLIATVIFAALLFVFTLGPFLWGLAFPPDAVKSTLPAAIAESINPNSPQAEEAVAPESGTTRNGPSGEAGKTNTEANGETGGLPSDPDDLLKKLNLDGDKNGAPTTNPLGDEP